MHFFAEKRFEQLPVNNTDKKLQESGLFFTVEMHMSFFNQKCNQQNEP